MPLETLQRPARQTARTPLAATPPRLRPKGPVGPDFYQRGPAAAGRPRQSAVERLEADKAKYVKSQVALSKQQPVRPPDTQKPPLAAAAAALRPTRKAPTAAATKKEAVQLNLEHLTSLINVSDGPQPGGAEVDPEPRPPHAGPQQRKERPCPPPRPDWSSPAKVRLKAARSESPGSAGSPAAVTVRRVDVLPQAGPARPPPRPPQYIRQPLQPIPLHTQFPLRQTTSQRHLFHPRTAGRSALKPVPGPLKPDHPPSFAPPPPRLPVSPPPSSTITRPSPSSSRKRPSLTRSKSDMSDRCSRAGTDLERFFNLCGLDPADLQDWTGSSSDIVSMARFRSVSAPGSGREEGEEEEEEEEEEAAGNPAGRVPYGVSVIERNARVIKWLYGLRHAKDGVSKSTNL